MKKILVFLLAAFMLLCAARADSYRTLTLDMKGDDVLAMKQRLYELGYFTTASLTDTMTENTLKVIRAFQESNGLETTGTADSRTQALLFSSQAKDAGGKPAGTGSPSAMDVQDETGEYRDLKPGSYGSDVETLKRLLQKLGFYTGKTIGNRYDAAAEEAVRKYQQSEDLEETGNADAALQRRLAGETIAASIPPASEIAAVGPDVALSLPETDENGFLADPDSPPFVYEDSEAGYWLYIDPELRVEICRYQQSGKKVLWYEADVRCRESVRFTSILAEGNRRPGWNFTDPITLAEKSGAVFAVTDDNYGERWYRTSVDYKKGYYQGVVIRDGDVKADIQPPETYTKFPSLDVMAYYPDGTVELYGAREHTAQEYLDMGVLSTWAFGPILLRDGQPNDYIWDQTQLSYEAHMEKAPRMAMGVYGKGHYVFIDVVGRSAKSAGVNLPWLIDRMRQLGVENAFNLDGGQTAVMCFMGKPVNKSPSVDRNSLRKVSSMIGFGLIDR